MQGNRPPAADIAAHGGRAGCYQAGIAREVEAAAMVTFRAASFGGLHVLVNNAAISQGYALDQIDGAYFERIYATNVTGTQLAATHAARWMTGQIIIARGGAV